MYILKKIQFILLILIGLQVLGLAVHYSIDTKRVIVPPNDFLAVTILKQQYWEVPDPIGGLPEGEFKMQAAVVEYPLLVFLH